MSLLPLLTAPIATQVHAFAAILAFGLGIWQLAATKGNARHRLVGWLWAATMLVVAGSSFLVSHMRQFGPFSVIHLLSVWVLVAVPLAVHAARSGRHRSHAIWMISIFVGALVVAGMFTLLPGRIMHAVLFGA